MTTNPLDAFKQLYDPPKDLLEYLEVTGWEEDRVPTEVNLPYAKHFNINAGSDQSRLGPGARSNDGYNYVYEIAVQGTTSIFIEHRFGGFTGNQHYKEVLFQGKVESAEKFRSLLWFLQAEQHLRPRLKTDLYPEQEKAIRAYRQFDKQIPFPTFPFGKVQIEKLDSREEEGVWPNFVRNNHFIGEIHITTIVRVKFDDGYWLYKTRIIFPKELEHIINTRVRELVENLQKELLRPVKMRVPNEFVRDAYQGETESPNNFTITKSTQL